eukprot:793604_1
MWSTLIGDTGTAFSIRVQCQRCAPTFRHRRCARNTRNCWPAYHDYGEDNGGATFVNKKETQKIYLDFIGEPTDSPRRSQQGIYTSYTLGPPGRRVKLILLDNRYHRTENDVLGAAQWKWLRGELENSDAQIHIFGAGLQIIADDKQSMWPDLESFSLYGKSNQRLYDVLVETKTRGALLLSGDIHLSEINVLHCTGLGYPLFDITSSGMTHVWPWADTWIERTLYDLIFRHLLPGRFVVGGARFAQLNYGTLDIDWESSPVIVRAHIH